MADSIRAALTEAFEKVDAEKPDPVETTAESPPAEAPPAPPAEPKTDGKESSPEAPTAPVVAEAKAEQTAPVIGAPPASTAPASSAPPASWKPAEKAEWAKVPESVRAAVMRRETETSRALSASAEARKLAQRFEETINPFRPLMDAYGVKPVGRAAKAAPAKKTAAKKAAPAAAPAQTTLNPKAAWPFPSATKP
jgi:hypothetical protein